MKAFNRKIILCFALLLINSVAISDVTTTTTDPLYGHKWVLVILNNQGLVMEKFPQQKPYLELQPDGAFTASIGCNQLRGNFTRTDAESIVFSSENVATRMACPEYYMNLENEFLNILVKIKYWKIEDTKALYLLNEDKATLAILTNILVY